MKRHVHQNVMLGLTAAMLMGGALGASAEEAPTEFKNPLSLKSFTPDPNPFIGADGKMWVVVGRDKDDAVKFNMDEYSMLSSDNMVDWEDHGVILSVNDVPWMKSFWAASAIYKDGLYYLYAPDGGHGNMGVFTSESPLGPWKDVLGKPMSDICMDPHVFIDDDGQAYLTASIPHQKLVAQSETDLRTPFVVKLKPNMIEFDGPIRILKPTEYKFHCEASWLHKHNGKYYLSWKGWDEKKQYILYSMSDSPMGPFEYKGVVMEPTTGGNEANHHGIIEYEGATYMFYHSRPISNFRFRRNTSVARLYYNEDGTIKKVEEPAYDPERIRLGKEKLMKHKIPARLLKKFSKR